MYFPVGDIHGRYDLARKLYDAIVHHIRNGIDPENGGTIVFLGDYIDRGPQSKEVCDFLMSLEDTDDIKHVMLKGNHEAFMINCRHHPEDLISLRSWLHHGGVETVDSFGVTVQEIVDGKLDEYIEWMEQLPVISYDEDYAFVHAGVSIIQPIDKQSNEHLLWDFDFNPAAYRDFNRVVVHGHLMKKDGPIVDLPNNRIWMDVGANLFDRLCTVGLPEPFDYGYDEGSSYQVIEVRV